MSMNVHGFLEWKEEFISLERGNRVVHYYLKDINGDSILAVIGTERSLRHMVYVVSEEFFQVYGSERSVNACFKWRSKREVVDWLTSMLSKQRPPRDCSMSPRNDLRQALGSPDYSKNGFDATGVHLTDRMNQIARKLKGHTSDIFWSGDSWTCGKQLKHYPAFCRNGITIAMHSFVFVMAEEENHYLAYLEDMYEDRKGQKKVRVRWFHDDREVGRAMNPPNPHSREVFITPHAQVISAECVDGPATVLTPKHYEKCLAVVPHASLATIHLCFRQFRNNRIKPFDLTKLRGYVEQPILSCLEEAEELSPGGNKQGTKRTRSCRGRQRFAVSHSGLRVSAQRNQITACGPGYQNLRFGLLGRRPLAVKYVGPETRHSLPFIIDEKIEILCQDSGIRGCWFKCKILRASRKKLKVRYDDVQDEDGCGNLEEWIPACRLAAPDKLGMRCSGRLTVRPCPPPQDIAVGVFEIGSPVDAWWNDGWWEGVVTGIDNCGNDDLQVYFPGEDLFSTFQRRNLRISRDWVSNQWVDIEARPDILSVISTDVSPGMKLSACSNIAKGTESGSSAVSEREVHTILKLDTVEEDKQELSGSARSEELVENMKWVKSKKRPLTEDEVKGGNDGDEDQEENMKWVKSKKRPLTEDEVKGGNDGDEDQDEDTEDRDFNDDDDDVDKGDMEEDIEAVRHNFEAEAAGLTEVAV